MLETAWELVRTWLALGRDVEDVGGVPMMLRTLVVYAFTLAIVLLGSKRLLGRATAFDAVVAIMLGSIMSRAINGSAPLFPTLLAGVALVALHKLLAYVAFHTDWFGFFVKGEPILLVKDGEVQLQALRREHLSTRDLEEALRLQGSPPDLAKVKLAYLERNGRISIVPCPDEPRVLEVAVADGVQRVRIELG